MLKTIVVHFFYRKLTIILEVPKFVTLGLCACSQRLLDCHVPITNFNFFLTYFNKLWNLVIFWVKKMLVKSEFGAQI